jgi:hypothetical protein
VLPHSLSSKEEKDVYLTRSLEEGREDRARSAHIERTDPPRTLRETSPQRLA